MAISSSFLSNVTVETLVVAGGGGGGTNYNLRGAGGGAGGLVYIGNLQIPAGTTANVIVGSGGNVSARGGDSAILPYTPTYSHWFNGYSTYDYLTATIPTTTVTTTAAGSLFFVSSSLQYLSIPSNSAFDQNGQFTWECWFYTTNISSGYIWGILQSGMLGLAVGNGGVPGKLYVDKSFVGVQITSTTTITTNTWYHVAVCFDGTNTRLFLNGGLEGTVAGGGAVSAAPLWIGNYNNGALYFNGYITNFRITKAPLYVAAFTPPSLPVTNLLNTKFLLLVANDANKIIDSSPSALTVTNNGSATFTSTVVPTRTITSSTINVTTSAAGSLSFNGISQYLSITGTTSGPLDLAAGAGNWTVELWVYPRSVTGEQVFFWKGGTTGSVNPSYAAFMSGSGGQFIVGDGAAAGANINFPAGTFAINTWHHFALVRSGTNFTAWVNGAVAGTPFTTAFTMSNTGNNTLTIGSSVADGSTRYFNGLITNFRIVKGTAVYTSAFVPILPITNLFATSLLLLVKSDANKIVDSSINNTVITNVNAATFSATVPSVTSAVAPLSFLYNDFTVEAWIYLNAYGATATGIIETRTGVVAQPWAFGLNGTSLDFYWGTGSTTRVTSSMRVPSGQWTHVAATRLNGVVNLYINGFQDINYVNAGVVMTQSSNTVWIGNYRDGAATGQNTYSANVYISNLRTVNGTAVYTANFTPQTTNLSNIAGTTMLTLQNSTLVDNGLYNLPIVKYYGSVSPSIFSQSTPSTDGYASVYFNGATMLQYANSAALTTIAAVDISLNQFTVTSPAAVPSTVAAAPAITPLDTYNSMSFTASSQYFLIAANSQTAFQSNNFTIELWVYLTNGAANTLYPFYTNYTTFGANSIYFGKHTVASGTVCVYIGTYSQAGPLLQEAALPASNVWIHYALVRNGGTFTLYKNGNVSVSSSAYNGSVTSTTNPNYIGVAGDVPATYQFLGYMSNFRIVSNVAVYTGKFTVPTAPLTITQSSGGANISAITGTQTSLLLQPAAGWTAECWVNPSGDYGTYRTVFAKRVTTSATTEFEGYLRTGTGVISFYNGTNYESTTTLTANTWSHCAWVYTGTNIVIYVNGTQVYTSAVTITTNTEPIIIGGARGYSEYFLGFLSNFRFTRGIVYTGNFTRPTTPLRATQTVSGNIAAITGNASSRTNLLVLQSSTYKDNSANNYLYGYTYTINTGTPLIKTDVVPFVDPVRGVIAYGGGGGGFNDNTPNANSGGSSGASWNPGYTALSSSQPTTSYYNGVAYANTGFGNVGGVGGGAQPYGGGGGGAGSAGDSVSVGTANGGIGRQYTISGVPTYYAGGGSSAGYPLNAGYQLSLGGLGGGGQGDNSVWAAAQVTGYAGSTGTVNVTANGTPYTGGGGGSGGYGGSGIVVMRYLGTQIATGGTVTSIGGYTIHTFTTAGTFTIAANISVGSAGGNGGPYAGGGGGAAGYLGFGGNGAAGASLAAGSYGIGGGAGGGGSSATFGGGGGGVDIWGLGGYSGAGGAAGQPGTGGSPEIILGLTGNGAQPGFGSNGGLYGGGGGGGVTSSLDTSQGWGANGAFALVYSTTSSTYTYPYISPINLVYLGNLQSTNTTAIGSNVAVIVLDNTVDQQVYNALGYGPTNANSNVAYEYPTNNNTALVTIARAPVAGNNIVGSTDINITVNYQAEWMLRNSDPAFPATYDKPFNYQYAQPITTTNDPRKLTLKATYITKTGTQDDSTEPDQYL